MGPNVQLARHVFSFGWLFPGEIRGKYKERSPGCFSLAGLFQGRGKSAHTGKAFFRVLGQGLQHHVFHRRGNGRNFLTQW